MHRFQSILRPLYCVLIIGLAVAPALAVESSPYEARVVASGASVHSGPGEKFYPTDTLAQGDVVEVYREKPGGWLAIRPPANSFSWVAGKDLKLQDGGLAEITSDDVVSRIGSRLSEQRNATQILLKQGEVVEVLDEQRINGETWYKIAPPAGEFRWIQTALVERIGPIQMVSAESTEPANKTTVETKGEAAAPPLRATTTTPNDPPASAATPLPPAPPISATTAPAAPATPAATSASTPRPAGPVADDLSRELAGIELRLSRMVAAPVNLWNTDRLQRDATQLLSRAQTPADRQAVQATLNKINQFGAIGRRATPATSNIAQAGQPVVTPLPSVAAPAAMAGSALAASAVPNVMPGATDPATGLVAGLPNTAAVASPSGAPYDAVGVLRPVVSKRPGAPQFALVDDRGQVLSFVTPTPDMNLQPYLGRRVGVVGNRGYIAEFNRSHVTAARVTPISDRVLR